MYYAFCFDVAVNVLVRAMDAEYPFLYAVTSDNDDTVNMAELLKDKDKDKRRLSGRIVNSRNNEIIHF